MKKVKKLLALIAAIATTLTMLPALPVGAADADYIIANAEFNGSDDTSKWSNFDSSNNQREKDTNGEVADGYLMTTPSNTGYGCWGVYFGEEDNAYAVDSTKKNIYLETRFKLTSDSKDASGINTYFYALTGKCSANSAYKVFSTIGATAGKMVYGHEGGTTTSDYDINLNTWYTIKACVDFSTKQTTATITDESGNKKTVTWNFLWGSDFVNISQVTSVQNAHGGYTYYTDYLRVYDADLMPTPTVKYNGADLNGAVINDTAALAEITFGNAITEEQAEQVTVNDATVEKYIDGNTLYFYMSDLESRKSYTINIPALNGNLATSVTFTTADESYYITRNEFDGNDNTSKWSCFLAGDDLRNNNVVGEINDGYLVTTPSNTSFGKWGVYFGEGEDAYPIANTKKNIYLETRFKLTEDNGSTDSSSVETYFYAVTGKCTSNNLYRMFSRMGAKDGKLTYGTESGDTTTDYDISLNTWYTISARLNFADKKTYATVTDEDGNETTLSWQFLWGAEFDSIKQITGIQNAHGGYTHYTDYLRVYDKDLMPKEKSPYDFYAEFDGDDDTSKWANYDSSNNKRDHENGLVEDDVLKCTTSNTGYGRWGVYFGIGEDAYTVADDETDITISTKVKVTKTSDSITALPDAEWLSIWGRRTSQSQTDNLQLLDLGAKNGKLAYGYPFDSATELDYDLSFDIWYDISVALDYDARKAYLTIKSGNDDAKEFEIGFTWGLQFENITQIQLSKNLTPDVTYNYDYLRLLKAEFVTTFVLNGVAFNEADSTVDATFTYNSPDTESVMFIVAQYDSNNKYIGMTYVNGAVEKGSGKTIVVTSPSADTIKAFAWNNTTTLAPVSSTYTN